MKIENVKVSIIIPIYNMEKHLRYCLDSAIVQDLDNIEFICINDGSTDTSLAVLREYQKKDERFIIINQINQGVAKSRNLGIRKATGKYVAFLDPDDFLPDTNIMSVLYKAAEQNDVFIAGGEFSEINKKGKINFQYEGRLKGYTFEHEGITYYSNYQFDYGYHRFIYNRKFLVEHELFFPNLVRFQDPPFMVRAFTLADKFFAIKKVTYCYRVGYRLPQWTKVKVEDLLVGLHMNMIWAMRYQLFSLMDLCIERLTKEYFEIIMSYFFKDLDIRDIVYGIIFDKQLAGNEELSNFDLIIINYLVQQYEHVLKSKSYRVGRFITFLPRKIKKIVLFMVRKK